MKIMTLAALTAFYVAGATGAAFAFGVGGATGSNGPTAVGSSGIHMQSMSMSPSSSISSGVHLQSTPMSPSSTGASGVHFQSMAPISSSSGSPSGLHMQLMKFPGSDGPTPYNPGLFGNGMPHIAPRVQAAINDCGSRLGNLGRVTASQVARVGGKSRVHLVPICDGLNGSLTQQQMHRVGSLGNAAGLLRSIARNPTLTAGLGQYNYNADDVLGIVLGPSSATLYVQKR